MLDALLQCSLHAADKHHSAVGCRVIVKTLDDQSRD